MPLQQIDWKAIAFLLPAVLVLRNGLADLAIVLIGLGFLIVSWRNHSFAWIQTPWVMAGLGLAGWAALRTLTLLASDYEVPISLSGLYVWRWPLFAAAMVFGIMADPTARVWFNRGLFALFVFIVIDTCIQYFVGVEVFGHLSVITPVGDRLTGPFTKLVPGTYSSRLLFPVLILIYLYFADRRLTSWAIASLIVTPAITLGMIFLTGERGAFLITGLLSAVTGLAALWFFPTHRTQILIVSVGSLGLAVALAMTQPNMLQRTIFSATTYIANWSSSPSSQSILPAIEIARHTHPITGIGIGNYETVCELANFDYLGPRYCAHPHNVYVETAIELGVIGLVALLTLLVTIFYQIGQMKGPNAGLMRVLLCCTLLATFWPLMGSMSLYSNRLASIVWLTIAWSLAFARTSNES